MKNYPIKIVVQTSVMLCTLLIGFKVQSQDLSSLIEEGLKNNPEIQKFEIQHAISAERVNEVQMLPNSEFAVGYFVSEPETRTGAQRFKVSAKQMLPWFGSITAREKYAHSLADAKYVDIVIAKRKLIAAISQAYYTLYTNRAKQKVLDENIQLLKTYETFGLTFVEIGKASAVDILRLQMRQNELDQLKKVLAQQYVAEQTTLNKLLNRDKSIPIVLVDKLSIPPVTNLMSSNELSLHPELIKYDKLYQSVVQSELLNQKERAPMIGFGLDYINVDQRPNMNFSDNGKDIVMPMVAVSIPIFTKKYRSQTKQNQLQQQEITAEKQARMNALETALEKAIRDRNAASISYTTQGKNLAQASSAKEIVLKNYETGSIDFTDVLDIQELQLKFQINQLDAIRTYYEQTTIINYLSN